MIPLKFVVLTFLYEAIIYVHQVLTNTHIHIHRLCSDPFVYWIDRHHRNYACYMNHSEHVLNGGSHLYFIQFRKQHN